MAIPRVLNSLINHALVIGIVAIWRPAERASPLRFRSSSLLLSIPSHSVQRILGIANRISGCPVIKIAKILILRSLLLVIPRSFVSYLGIKPCAIRRVLRCFIDILVKRNARWNRDTSTGVSIPRATRIIAIGPLHTLGQHSTLTRPVVPISFFPSGALGLRPGLPDVSSSVAGRTP